MTTLRDNADRARQTASIFQALAVVLVLSIVSDFWYLDAVSAGHTALELNATALGGVHNLLILAEFLLLVIGFVLFLRWLRRAYWNLRALGRPMEHGDGWAVVAWFIPIANMFLPYAIVREVWRKTQLVAFEQARPHGLLRGWWLLFVGHVIISNVTTSMAGTADTTEQRQSAAWGSIFTDMLMLATIVLTVLVVRRIARDEAQMDLRLQVSRLGGAAPQPVAELLEDQSDYEY